MQPQLAGSSSQLSPNQKRDGSLHSLSDSPALRCARSHHLHLRSTRNQRLALQCALIRRDIGGETFSSNTTRQPTQTGIKMRAIDKLYMTLGRIVGTAMLLLRRALQAAGGVLSIGDQCRVLWGLIRRVVTDECV